MTTAANLRRTLNSEGIPGRKMEEKGNIDVPTHHMSADTVESASNPAYPTSNPNEVAGDPAYPPAAYPEQLGYPPTYPHQTAGAYPSAYPQQPMANSTYPVQPVGAQPFTAVTVVNQPKHGDNSAPSRPPTYLPFTVFNIVCCCFLLGILAKRSGAQVVYEYERRNYAEAKKASNKALGYNVAGLIVGILIWVIVIVVIVAYLLF